jgi:hypothetical protein
MTVLRCAHCGTLQTHHDTVEIFDREPDAETGFRVTVTPQRTVQIGTNLRGNPSSRRSGVAIRYWCESCGGRSVLTIAQHKGLTLMDAAIDTVLADDDHAGDANDQSAGATGPQENQE